MAGYNIWVTKDVNASMLHSRYIHEISTGFKRQSHQLTNVSKYNVINFIQMISNNAYAQDIPTIVYMYPIWCHFYTKMDQFLLTSVKMQHKFRTKLFRQTSSICHQVSFSESLPELWNLYNEIFIFPSAYYEISTRL